MTTQINMADRLWSILRPLGWIGIGLVLLAPAVAMRFTPEVHWTLSDFLFAGVVLIGAAAIIELFAWRVRNPAARIGFALVMVAVVALIWGASID